MFEPCQVVDRDSGQPGQLFSAQPGRTTASANGDTDRGGLHAVAPATHRATELPRVHPFSKREAGGLGKVLSWYWQSYENATTA